MAVLETIRNKFGILITVLIAVALLSFIIDPSSLASLTGGQQIGEETEVASINGTSVSYTDFNNEVMKLGKGSENQVFINFLNRYLYVPTAKNAGFNVSEDEMYNLLSGNVNYPSYVIRTAFGNDMNPETLVKMEENAENDPSGTTAINWENIKENVEAERYITKYGSYLSKSLFSNSLLIEEEIKNSNNVFDVEFVMVPATSDSLVVVSEQEIRNYYNAHKNLYPCNETRDIEYVVVEYNDENEETVYNQIDSVFNNVNNIESLIKTAVDNEYSIENINVPMYANSFGSIAKVENIVKWAFKEPSANVVSDIFTVEDEENKYFIIAGLSKINPQGYEPLEKVSENIKAILEREKAADMKLAEVKEKVNGLTDLEKIAAALGTTVSTKENLTFASADFDPKFTGAVSVAETGVVSAPFKGSEGIYVYKVTNRSEEPYFTEENAKMKMAGINARNSELLDYILLKNVKNNIYLYF